MRADQTANDILRVVANSNLPPAEIQLVKTLLGCLTQEIRVLSSQATVREAEITSLRRKLPLHSP